VTSRVVAVVVAIAVIIQSVRAVLRGRRVHGGHVVVAVRATWAGDKPVLVGIQALAIDVVAVGDSVAIVVLTIAARGLCQRGCTTVTRAVTPGLSRLAASVPAADRTLASLLRRAAVGIVAIIDTVAVVVEAVEAQACLRGGRGTAIRRAGTTILEWLARAVGIAARWIARAVGQVAAIDPRVAIVVHSVVAELQGAGVSRRVGVVTVKLAKVDVDSVTVVVRPEAFGIVAVEQAVAVVIGVVAAGLGGGRVAAVALAVAHVLRSCAGSIAAAELLLAGIELSETTIAVAAILDSIAVIVQVVEAKPGLRGQYSAVRGTGTNLQRIAVAVAATGGLSMTITIRAVDVAIAIIVGAVVASLGRPGVGGWVRVVAVVPAR
jgi:hypothetical protein